MELFVLILIAVFPDGDTVKRASAPMMMEQCGTMRPVYKKAMESAFGTSADTIIVDCIQYSPDLEPPKVGVGA